MDTNEPIDCALGVLQALPLPAADRAWRYASAQDACDRCPVCARTGRALVASRERKPRRRWISRFPLQLRLCPSAGRCSCARSLLPEAVQPIGNRLAGSGPEIRTPSVRLMRPDRLQGCPRKVAAAHLAAPEEGRAWSFGNRTGPAAMRRGSRPAPGRAAAEVCTLLMSEIPDTKVGILPAGKSRRMCHYSCAATSRHRQQGTGGERWSAHIHGCGGLLSSALICCPMMATQRERQSEQIRQSVAQDCTTMGTSCTWRAQNEQ